MRDKKERVYINISVEYVLVPYTSVCDNCVMMSMRCEVTRSWSAAISQDWRQILRDT